MAGYNKYKPARIEYQYQLSNCFSYVTYNNNIPFLIKSHDILRQILRIISMEIHVIPMLKDNYGYVVKCSETSFGAFVDVAAGEHGKAIEALKRYDVKEYCILSTHKHADHSGVRNSVYTKVQCLYLYYLLQGNLSMKSMNPSVKVYGGEIDKIPGCTHPVKDADTINIGNLQVTVISAPW